MNKIWVIDDQDNYREGVKNLIDIKISDCEVETFGCNSEFEIQTPPDLIIIDPSDNIQMSLDLIDYVIKRKTKVVILSMEMDRDSLLQLLSRNLHGFLLKGMNTSDLLKSIRYILQDEPYIHPAIANVLLEEYQKNNQKQSYLETV